MGKNKGSNFDANGIEEGSCEHFLQIIKEANRSMTLTDVIETIEYEDFTPKEKKKILERAKTKLKTFN